MTILTLHAQATASTKRIVLADLDDRLLMWLVVRLPQKFPEFEFVVATNRLASFERPTVIVTALDEARGVDEDHLVSLSSRHPEARIIAVPTNPSVNHDRLLVLGADRVMSTVMGGSPLAHEIAQAAHTETVLSGELHHLGIGDLVQVMCLNRHTVTVRIESTWGKGVVWIVRGELVHALWSDLRGDEAIAAMLELTDGRFRVYEAFSVPERSLIGDWQQILIEAAQRKDEDELLVPPKPWTSKPQPVERASDRERLTAAQLRDLFKAR